MIEELNSSLSDWLYPQLDRVADTLAKKFGAFIVLSCIILVSMLLLGVLCSFRQAIIGLPEESWIHPNQSTEYKIQRLSEEFQSAQRNLQEMEQEIFNLRGVVVVPPCTSCVIYEPEIIQIPQQNVTVNYWFNRSTGRYQLGNFVWDSKGEWHLLEKSDK